jgi:hypothetical protein
MDPISITDPMLKKQVDVYFGVMRKLRLSHGTLTNGLAPGRRSFFAPNVVHEGSTYKIHVSYIFECSIYERQASIFIWAKDVPDFGYLNVCVYMDNDSTFFDETRYSSAATRRAFLQSKFFSQLSATCWTAMPHLHPYLTDDEYVRRVMTGRAIQPGILNGVCFL